MRKHEKINVDDRFVDVFDCSRLCEQRRGSRVWARSFRGGHMSSGSNRGGGRVSNSTLNSRRRARTKPTAGDRKAQEFKREFCEWAVFGPTKLWREVMLGTDKLIDVAKKEAAKTKVWQGKQSGWPSGRGVFGYSGRMGFLNSKNNK